MRKTTIWFSDYFQPNQPVQSQKKVRSVIEGLYFLYSKNKVADQLCSYCTADLRLCFAYACLFSHAVAHMLMRLAV